jgi:hypothetical protein
MPKAWTPEGMDATQMQARHSWHLLHGDGMDIGIDINISIHIDIAVHHRNGEAR